MSVTWRCFYITRTAGGIPTDNNITDAVGENAADKEEKMKETQIIRLPLQFFAEGDGTGTEPEGGSEGNGDDGEKVPTFDDILKDKSMQAEFDRRVSKAMEKQKATLTEEFGKTLEEKLSEAKKLEKLNAEQKAEYERQMKDKALAEREAAVAKRELTAEAISQLAEKGLPQELSTCLNYDSAEACKTSLEAVEKAFSAAVEKAVNDKLRGNPPKMGNQPGGGNKINSLADAIRARKN